MARHLLLRQDGEALVILRQLIADGTIRATELASWPLFDRVRQAGLLSNLLGPAGDMAMTDAITEERYRKLIDLAVERVRDAESCADAGCYPAACVMAGAGTEAAIMAMSASLPLRSAPPAGGVSRDLHRSTGALSSSSRSR